MNFFASKTVFTGLMAIALATPEFLQAQARTESSPPDETAIVADQTKDAIARGSMNPAIQKAITDTDRFEAAAKPGNTQPSESEADADAAQLRFQQAVEEHLAAESAEPELAQELLRRAAAGYSRVLELRPGAVAALYNLGRVQFALDDFVNAEKSFELAASRPGNNRFFYLQKWADFQRDQGRLENASRDYEEVVLLEPRLDEPHKWLANRYLEMKEDDPDKLLEYLWRLITGRQATRAAELALDAFEAEWPAELQPEILSAIALSLSQMYGPTSEIVASRTVRRLGEIRSSTDVDDGITELLQLYETPGRYLEPFEWWGRSFPNWNPERGIAPSDSFRATLRAIGDRYRETGEMNVASACYLAAVDLDSSPDPLALRSLANIYVEQSNIDALDRLAQQYADPAGQLFAAKNRAYELGQLDKILDYHRALGQIYGSLAASGKIEWGTTRQPATAMFQLDRAFKVAQRIDREAQQSGTPETTRVDPDLTLLYSQGLEASGERERGVQVRLDAAKRYEEVGDYSASQKVLRGVSVENMSTNQKQDFERYQRIDPDSALHQSPTDSKFEINSTWQESVNTVIEPYSNAELLKHRDLLLRAPIQIDVPDTDQVP